MLDTVPPYYILAMAGLLVAGWAMASATRPYGAKKSQTSSLCRGWVCLDVDMDMDLDLVLLVRFANRWGGGRPSVSGSLGACAPDAYLFRDWHFIGVTDES